MNNLPRLQKRFTIFCSRLISPRENIVNCEGPLIICFKWYIHVVIILRIWYSVNRLCHFVWKANVLKKHHPFFCLLCPFQLGFIKIAIYNFNILSITRRPLQLKINAVTYYIEQNGIIAISYGFILVLHRCSFTFVPFCHLAWACEVNDCTIGSLFW